MDNAYAHPTGEILAQFAVNEQKGLTSAQVEQAVRKYGRNGVSVKND